MSKVRAIIIHEHGAPLEVARLEEIELRAPGPLEAVVQMLAAPINPADLNVLEGTYPLRPALPGVPGNEGVGRVVELGGEVRGLELGSLVLLPLGVGTWQEKCVVRAADLLAVPAGIAPEQAAMLRVNPLTAWCLLHYFADLQRGDWILQNAANSGVGRAVAQIAEHLGVRTIGVVRRAEAREELAAATKAVVLLDDDDLGPAIQRATEGAPIRLAFNAVGGESALRLAQALAPGGTLVTYGAMSRQALKIPNGMLIFQDLRWRGFWVTHWLQQATAAERASVFSELFTLAQRGVVQARIARIYPVEAITEALAASMKSGRSGKVLLGFEEQLCRAFRREPCHLATLAAAMGALVYPPQHAEFAVLFGQIYQSWGRKGIIEPSGGRYFFHRTELAVPAFRQGDDRWRSDRLGPTGNSLGAEGCAVASAAMVLASYGYDTDPQRLNAFLTPRGGYTSQGWLYWEKAAEIAEGRVRHAYEDLPSYDLIDANLARGNPVIVRLRLPSRTTHFVVIAGKEGFDYLTRDPGAGAAKGLYPLREFGSRIEALRFYERVN